MHFFLLYKNRVWNRYLFLSNSIYFDQFDICFHWFGICFYWFDLCFMPNLIKLITKKNVYNPWGLTKPLGVILWKSSLSLIDQICGKLHCEIDTRTQNTRFIWIFKLFLYCYVIEYLNYVYIKQIEHQKHNTSK